VSQINTLHKEGVRKDNALAAERRKNKEDKLAEIEQQWKLQRTKSDHDIAVAKLKNQSKEEQKKLEILMQEHKQRAERSEAQLQAQARAHADQQAKQRLQAQQVLSDTWDEEMTSSEVVEQSDFDRALQATPCGAAASGDPDLAPKPVSQPLSRRQAIHNFEQAPLPEHALDKKIDGEGIGRVRCAVCRDWKKMRNLKMDFFATHLRSCLQKNPRTGHVATLDNFFKRTTKTSTVSDPSVVTAAAASVAPLVEAAQEIPRVLACQGVFPPNMVPDVHNALLTSLKEFCEQNNFRKEKYLVSLLSDLYVTLEKQASNVDQKGYANGAAVLEVVEGIKRLRSKWCGKQLENGPPGVAEHEHMKDIIVIQRNVGTSNETWMGCTHWTICAILSRIFQITYKSTFTFASTSTFTFTFTFTPISTFTSTDSHTGICM
jgi:hypothetical protein